MPFAGPYTRPEHSIDAPTQVLPPGAVASFFVCRAQRNDAEGLASAVRDAVQSLFAESYPPDLLDAWTQTVTAESFRTAMDVGESYFVAIPQPHSRVILGLSSVRVVRDAFAIPVYVRPTAARQSIGRTLHRLPEYEARSRGALTLTIPTICGVRSSTRPSAIPRSGRPPSASPPPTTSRASRCTSTSPGRPRPRGLSGSCRLPACTSPRIRYHGGSPVARRRPMPNRAESLEKLKRAIEAKVEALDVRLTETEHLLAERQAAAEPADAPLLPVLRPKRTRKKS